MYWSVGDRAITVPYTVVAIIDSSAHNHRFSRGNTFKRRCSSQSNVYLELRITDHNTLSEGRLSVHAASRPLKAREQTTVSNTVYLAFAGLFVTTRESCSCTPL